MSSLARIAIVAAAVLMVGVVGFTLVGGGRPPNAVVVPSPSPSLASSPSPSPSTSPVPSPLVYTWPSSLAAGTYTTTLAWDVPFTTTFTVPAGWAGRDLEIRKDPGMMIGFLVVDDVFSDPCAHQPLEPRPDPEISALAEAVALIPHADATPAVPVSFAGAIGRYIELDIEADPGCALEIFGLWDPTDGLFRLDVPTGGPGPWPASYPHHRIWTLGVGAARYVIDAAWSADASPADLAELQSVIDSIRVKAEASTADCSVAFSGAAAGPDPSTYVATLGGSLSELLGPVPVPLPSMARPLAQVDFRTSGAGWVEAGGGSSRPASSLTGPAGVAAGFVTSTPVNGFQGSFVVNAPGRWLAELTGVAGECPHLFLIEANAS